MHHATRGIDTVLLDAAATATASQTSRLDTAGASHCTIRILVSQEITTDAEPITISLLHSADTVVSNFTTIVADQTFTTIGAAAELRYEIDLLGKEKWLRLTFDPTGTVDSDDAYAVAAVATLTRNLADPKTTAGMGDDTVVAV